MAKALPGSVPPPSAGAAPKKKGAGRRRATTGATRGSRSKPLAQKYLVVKGPTAATKRRLTDPEKVGLGAVGASLRRARSAARRIGGKALVLGGKKVGALARVGSRAALRGAAGALGRRAVAAVAGAPIAAGIAAYDVTSSILKYKAKKKETAQDQAFRLAQAYRAARVKAEKQAKRPLSSEEQAALRDSFHGAADKLGIRTPSGWRLP